LNQEVWYKIVRLPGDFSAASIGSGKKVAKRAGRRTTGRATGKALRKFFK